MPFKGVGVFLLLLLALVDILFIGAKSFSYFCSPIGNIILKFDWNLSKV